MSINSKVVSKQDGSSEVGTSGAAMKLASSRELYDYWSKLRGARSAPERSEIDPVAIRGVLADTFILEVDPAAGYPFRVAGARTSSLFQCELRGRPFLEIWHLSSRGEIADVLALVSDEASPVIGGVSAKAAGFQPVELELLVLPLRHRGATHARILGLCSPTSVPNWLGLAPVASMTLQSMRVLRGEDGQSLVAAANQSPATPQLEAIGRLVRRGHFQLFSNTYRGS
jgi:hypothetical protein